jgi:signal transduction histidine kinase
MSDAALLRRGIDALAEQLAHAAEGRFELQVASDVDDAGLQRLCALSNSLLRQLEASGQAQRQRMRHLRHELRTPLNAVIGYSEMLLEEFEETGARNHAADMRKVLQSSTRLLDLISELLDTAEVAA